MIITKDIKMIYSKRQCVRLMLNRAFRNNGNPIRLWLFQSEYVVDDHNWLGG